MRPKTKGKTKASRFFLFFLHFHSTPTSHNSDLCLKIFYTSPLPIPLPYASSYTSLLWSPYVAQSHAHQGKTTYPTVKKRWGSCGGASDWTRSHQEYFLKNWGNENRWLKVEIKNRLFSGDMPLMPYVLHSLGLGPLHSLPRYIFCHVITSYQNKMIPHLKLRVVLIFFFNKLANFLFFLILILCNL